MLEGREREFLNQQGSLLNSRSVPESGSVCVGHAEYSSLLLIAAQNHMKVTNLKCTLDLTDLYAL